MVLLLDQELADLMQRTDRLLLDRLGWDMAPVDVVDIPPLGSGQRPDGRPGHRLANGLGIGCIVLVTLDTAS